MAVGRRQLTLFALVLAFAPARAEAAVPEAARDVRAAIPAIEAYRADRGTYAGITLAKVRRYDRSIARIAFKRATKNAYCVQSTRPGRVVHFDGPRGPLRLERCGVRGAVVVTTAPIPVPGKDDAATAITRLRAAVPAIEAYGADNNGYAGLTLAKIHQYDYAVEGITVAWATASDYCIEATFGAATYRKQGPGGPIEPGACPAAP